MGRPGLYPLMGARDFSPSLSLRTDNPIEIPFLPLLLSSSFDPSFPFPSRRCFQAHLGRLRKHLSDL